MQGSRWHAVDRGGLRYGRGGPAFLLSCTLAKEPVALPSSFLSLLCPPAVQVHLLVLHSPQQQRRQGAHALAACSHGEQARGVPGGLGPTNKPWAVAVLWAQREEESGGARALLHKRGAWLVIGGELASLRCCPSMHAVLPVLPASDQLINQATAVP